MLLSFFSPSVFFFEPRAERGRVQCLCSRIVIHALGMVTGIIWVRLGFQIDGPCAASTNLPPPPLLRSAAFIDIPARPPAQFRPGFSRFRPLGVPLLAWTLADVLSAGLVCTREGCCAQESDSSSELAGTGTAGPLAWPRTQWRTWMPGGRTLGVRKSAAYHWVTHNFLVTSSQSLAAIPSHNRAKHHSRVCCV